MIFQVNRVSIKKYIKYFYRILILNHPERANADVHKPFLSQLCPWECG